MIVAINEELFLHSFDEFMRVIVPIENKSRYEKGQDKLTEDEMANLFIDMRKHYGISENPSENSR